jgi:GcrA cell cycle regulator
MPANAPTWTTERLERLKHCFEVGLSCREIAADIGVSRNAVIGKLSRLNLTRRDEGPRRSTRKDTVAERRTRTAPKAASKLRQHIRLAFSADSPLTADEPIHNVHCCSLLELSDERCRWPINTPGAEDFRFCGNVPVEGLPYCAGHTRLAYRPGSRQRVAR